MRQLAIRGCMDRAKLPFQKSLLEGRAPLYDWQWYRPVEDLYVFLKKSPMWGR